MTRAPLRLARLAVPALLALALAACSSPAPAPDSPAPAPATAPAPTPATAGPAVAAVCGNTAPGPATAPPGAVTVDPAVDGDLIAKSRQSPPGTTFWLAPGTHTLTADRFGQVAPKDGNVYLGAPGAVVDGRGANQYAFVGTARDVTLRHLTVRGFVPPQDQGVVNHDSGDGWTLEANTIEENQGAALMAGAHQVVRGNCLRNNGQYALNAYQPGNGIVGLVVEGNEITGNNTQDWEVRQPGCGCSGGAKLWSVNGADIRGNWIHDNHGTGLWADTNNNDVLVEDNVFENNDAEALFYETSYNLVFRDNVVRANAVVAGRRSAQERDDFPQGSVYLSESGGDPRLKARTDRIEIYGNRFENNWSGVTAWENADRYCNSPANTSTGVCTPFVPDTATCSAPAIANPPLYSDCRWKTQRVDVHDNDFVFTDPTLTCAAGYAGRMALLANYGTYPEWSPYRGPAVQDAITHDQDVRWFGNRYVGPWTFVLHNVGVVYPLATWQGPEYGQDPGSTFADGPSAPQTAGLPAPAPDPAC